jgi:hypothetical protein|tara:strand:- start:81 stop:236 length:156 start_codon:yes stop_codon:yes gene_type:complete
VDHINAEIVFLQKVVAEFESDPDSFYLLYNAALEINTPAVHRYLIFSVVAY